jgi:hypothetical protein
MMSESLKQGGRSLDWGRRGLIGPGRPAFGKLDTGCPLDLVREGY